jgi:hypothetical protein
LERLEQLTVAESRNVLRDIGGEGRYYGQNGHSIQRRQALAVLSSQTFMASKRSKER